jgi:hypothetical protein
MSNTEETARPGSWDEVRQLGRHNSYTADCLLELRARVERLEQDGPISSCKTSLRLAKMEQQLAALEQAQQGNSSASLTSSAPEPADEQTLHTVALRMVDTLANLDVLPEITDTIRQAIREPMAPPAPSTPAGQGELVRLVAELIAHFASTSRAGDDCTPAARRLIIAVVLWLEQFEFIGAASALRREVGR